MATSSSSEAQGSRRIEKCTPYFDALWFCYSPVYQMKQLYVYGTVDDCRTHWSKWFNCLRQKTRFKDEEPAAAAQPTHPIWQLRTKEEAQEFWKEEFGHLESDEDEDLPRKSTFF